MKLFFVLILLFSCNKKINGKLDDENNIVVKNNNLNNFIFNCVDSFMIDTTNWIAHIKYIVPNNDTSIIVFENGLGGKKIYDYNRNKRILKKLDIIGMAANEVGDISDIEVSDSLIFIHDNANRKLMVYSRFMQAKQEINFPYIGSEESYRHFTFNRKHNLFIYSEAFSSNSQLKICDNTTNSISYLDTINPINYVRYFTPGGDLNSKKDIIAWVNISEKLLNIFHKSQNRKINLYLDIAEYNEIEKLKLKNIVGDINTKNFTVRKELIKYYFLTSRNKYLHINEINDDIYLFWEDNIRELYKNYLTIINIESKHCSTLKLDRNYSNIIYIDNNYFYANNNENEHLIKKYEIIKI